MTRNSFLIAVSMLGAAFAFQAGAADDHGHHAPNRAKPAAAASAAMTDGEVRKVDKAAGKLTIKHGALPKFDMPPMTMAYRVTDKAMLDGLKPGDKLRFTAERIDGAITVKRIEPAR